MELKMSLAVGARPDCRCRVTSNHERKRNMDYKHTALILVGYQNDYFAKDGILRGVVEEPGRVDEVLTNTLALIRRLVPTDVSILSTPIVLTPDYRALASPVGILHAIKESGAFAAGTHGAQSIPELKAFGDRIQYVKGKVGFNAFSDTLLDDELKSRDIREVLLAGMVTSLCIDSTGRAAYERGYSVKVLSDCTSARTTIEQSYFCSSVFPLYGAVVSSAEV
jgi:nicotinamidase-related amidase